VSEPVSRAAVEAFYAAFVSRDPERIAALVDEDVEWTVVGPVDLMQVCGEWRGRAAVFDRYARLVPGVLDFVSLQIECLLVDGAHSAMLGRIASRQRESGRMISHRTAHFARYRQGRLLRLRVLTDSLDAAEQFTGHLMRPTDAAFVMHDNLVAL
jgi:ketosteroid isomerase-like protein